MQKQSHRRLLTSSVYSLSDIRWDKKYHFKFYSKILLKGKQDVKVISKESSHIKVCRSLILDVKKSTLKSLSSTLDNMKFFAKTIKSLQTENFSQTDQRLLLKKLLTSSLRTFNFWIEEAAWKWFLLFGRGPKTLKINFPRTHPQRAYPLFIELVRVLNYFTKSSPVRFKALSDGRDYMLTQLKEKLPQIKRKMHFEFDNFPDNQSKIEDYAFLGESCDLSVKMQKVDDNLFTASNISQIKELKFLDTEIVKLGNKMLYNLCLFKGIQHCTLDLRTDINFNIRDLYAQLKFPKNLRSLCLRIEDMGKMTDEAIPSFKEISSQIDIHYKAIDAIEKEFGYKTFFNEIESLTNLEDATFGISYDLERQHVNMITMYAFCKKLQNVKYLILENNLRSEEPEEVMMGIDIGILARILSHPESLRRLHLGINRLSYIGYEGYKFTNLRVLQTMSGLAPSKKNYEAYVRFIQDLSKSKIRNLTNLPYLGELDFTAWRDGEFKEVDEMFLIADEYVKLTEGDIIRLPDIIRHKRKLRTFYFAHEELQLDKGKLNLLKKGFVTTPYLDRYEIYLKNKQLLFNR